MHSEFEEFKSLRDFVDVGGFEDLLTNESFSLAWYFWQTIRHSFIWSTILFVVIYLLIYRRTDSKPLALKISTAVIVALLLVEILTKAREEELF